MASETYVSGGDAYNVTVNPALPACRLLVPAIGDVTADETPPGDWPSQPGSTCGGHTDRFQLGTSSPDSSGSWLL